jgi:GNAT superfamily N-acetyltransferase
MEVIGLTEEHEELYCICLKEYATTLALGVPRKRQWYEQVRDQGLRVELARDEDGQVAGMVQQVPVALAPHVEGEGINVILCIWVHGYDQGMGNRQGRGLGQALLAAAETQARAAGARGLAAWGLKERGWMAAAWFEDRGYEPVDESGWFRLVFKSFEEGVTPPRWVQRRKVPETLPDRARVVSFLPGWCTSGNVYHVWARQAADELGDRVVLEELDTFDPAVVAEWGIAGGIFIGDEEFPVTGDDSYEKMREWIRARIP